jgi:hypothetical protein
MVSMGERRRMDLADELERIEGLVVHDVIGKE